MLTSMLCSTSLLHACVRTGGVVPTVAGDLHEEYLGEVTRDALQQSRLKLEVGGAKGMAG